MRTRTEKTLSMIWRDFCTLRASHNKRNREQRIRISTYQKLCISQYMISDRLKFLFLFSVLCFFYCAEPLSWSEVYSINNFTLKVRVKLFTFCLSVKEFTLLKWILSPCRMNWSVISELEWKFHFKKFREIVSQFYADNT